jgi:hypothetical protein
VQFTEGRGDSSGEVEVWVQVTRPIAIHEEILISYGSGYALGPTDGDAEDSGSDDCSSSDYDFSYDDISDCNDCSDNGGDSGSDGSNAEAGVSCRGGSPPPPIALRKKKRTFKCHFRCGFAGKYGDVEAHERNCASGKR